VNTAEYRRMFSVEDRHWWYVALHELILSLVAAEGTAKGPLQIFDAGCGTGRLAELLTPYGDISGCDASPLAIAFCRQRGLAAMEQTFLQNVALPTNHYDVITCIDVLYHRGINDDVAILNKLRAALKPGGLLIIHLVAGPSLYSSHDVAVHSRERYTRPLLHQRLEKAGLIIERLTYRLAVLFPLIVIWRRLRRRDVSEAKQTEEIVSDVALPSTPINAALLRLIRAENWLLRHHDLPFGSSLLAICRRPL
jgi:SAM-dependent methyltransferase